MCVYTQVFNENLSPYADANIKAAGFDALTLESIANDTTFQATFEVHTHTHTHTHVVCSLLS